VANKGLAGGGFRKCGNDWSYGRFLGSVARKGVSGALEEGRGLGAGDERDCGAKRHRIVRRAGKKLSPSNKLIVLHRYGMSRGK